MTLWPAVRHDETPADAWGEEYAIHCIHAAIDDLAVAVGLSRSEVAEIVRKELAEWENQNVAH